MLERRKKQRERERERTEQRDRAGWILRKGNRNRERYFETTVWDSITLCRPTHSGSNPAPEARMEIKKKIINQPF